MPSRRSPGNPLTDVRDQDDLVPDGGPESRDSNPGSGRRIDLAIWLGRHLANVARDRPRVGPDDLPGEIVVEFVERAEDAI